MKRVLWLLVLLVVFLAICSPFYFRNITAQENQPVSDVSAVIVEKLDKILDNQASILNQMEELKKELKARCTR